MEFKFIKKKATVFLLGGILLSSGLTTGFQSYLGNDIIFSHHGIASKITTYSLTVGDLLKSEGIVLQKGEIVKPGINEKITEDMEVKVLKPENRKITIDGITKDYMVAGETTEEILRQANITLKDNETVVPALDKKVKKDEVIVITRNAGTITENTREIPFNTITKKDDSLYIGQEKVIQEGRNGLVKETIEQQKVDGQVVSSIVIGTEIVKEPVNKIIAQGTKEQENMIQGKKYIKKITMEATAYDPTAGSKTAMGTRARVGAVAVDPRVIPLGTKLYIESTDGFPTYGFAVAEDTGGAIKGNRIDLFYNTNREANRFGRRNVTVYVLAE
ncbi:MAG: 3D domain-containing protein [Tissierellia bacterium]|nr:3D domain-containing protein [Tissierellia bacterium]